MNLIMVNQEKKEKKPAKAASEAAARDEQKPKESAPIERVIPDFVPGMTIRVHQRILGGEKERTQVFEGMVIGRRGGKSKGATFTVRKVTDGIGVERIFPLHSPIVKKIEITKRAKVRRAKLYYLKDYGKKLKEVAIK